MFSYYGSKSKIVDYYPPPKFDKIIEPFAGSARYSLKWFEKEVLLVDKFPVIINIWKWLQLCSEKDILGLPNLKKGDDLREFNLSEEEKQFIGFCINRGSVTPKNIVSNYCSFDTDKKRVAKNLFKIRHWEFINCDYKEIKNESATWFIDPPYKHGGDHYIESNNSIDFNYLAQWCKSRIGQVVVCENSKADWLPFYTLTALSGQRHLTYEVIWTNLDSSYRYYQTTMF
jgi:site-specific DNA-adenine methylase